MTLSLYVARRFALAFALVFSIFFALMFLIDLLEQIRRFSAAQITLSQAMGLSLLNTPQSVYRILPLIAILASVALFLGLARTSELVVIRAAGRSALRTLVAPVTATILIGALAVAVFNPLVAATSKRYEAQADRFRRGDGSVLSVTREGLWLRQGGADGQTVIHATSANPDGTVLHEVTFLTFAGAQGPTRRIEAAQAELARGAWLLSTAKDWHFDPGRNAELDATTADRLTLPSDLTPDRIRAGFGTPSSISIWQLPGFIADLERAGFSARKHSVWFQTELALPLLLAAMVLVGAGFTMRHARSGGTGLMVLMAMASGFAIFFLRNFALVLGENGQIPVAMAAWIPPVAATLLALSLLLHLEDG